MTTFHVFGPVADPALLKLVAGDDVRLTPIALPRHGFVGTERHGNPSLGVSEGQFADGFRVEVESGQASEEIEFWLVAHGWTAATVTVRADGETQDVVAFANWQSGSSEAIWPAALWRDRWTPVWLAAVDEILSFRGTAAPAAVTGRLPVIWTRAQSAVNARSVRRPSPSGLDVRDIEVIEQSRPYSEFFALQESRLRHRRFDGGQSQVLDRAVFVTADAVTVLPYDSARDRVLLIEQFRPGVLARGDQVPWVLEPVAGRIEPGDTAEETAMRETVEEAGLDLTALHRISGYYSTPGCLTEYLYSFVGEADLADGVAQIGGLASENEDIRSYLMSREEMMALISDGTIVNGPLLLSAFWLQANLARFQSLG